MPFETYATLLNLRKILPSVKSNYVAVDRDYWIALLATRIGEVPVDEEWYLRQYADVADAIRGGFAKSALEHYCFFGYFEHRMPYQIMVDPAWYASEYADVHLALTQNVFASAQEHFEAVGFREGRHPYPGFALRKSSDPDTEQDLTHRGRVPLT